MADSLSIAASVVGIIVPALHGTRLLLEDLQQLKDAPKAVKRLTDDVHSVHTTLELLKKVEDRDWESLGQGVAEQSKATIILDKILKNYWNYKNNRNTRFIKIDLY